MLNKRIHDYNFVKGILITLMVFFHLTLTSQSFLIVKEWVYIFHMSGFLVLSGFFFNDNSSKFLKTFTAILWPYLLFNTLYMVALSVMQNYLPTNNRVEPGILSILSYVAFKPSGTYWYLHTMALCMLGTFAASRLRCNLFNQIIIAGTFLFIISLFVEGFSFIHVIYFMIGYIIRKSGSDMRSIIHPSILSVVPIILITIFSDNLNRTTLSGIALTLFMLSFLLAVYNHLNISFIRNTGVWIGRNSMAIVLFSPIFTIATKLFAPLFAFDTTHTLWSIVSTIFVIASTLICARICDKIKLSALIMHRNMYMPYTSINTTLLQHHT